jgi:hypothetical protein
LQLDYGQFDIILEGDGSDTCYQAFDVIPKMGYRKSEVKLSVTDPKTLDYDEGSCNEVIVKVRRSHDFYFSFSGLRYETKAKNFLSVLSYLKKFELNFVRILFKYLVMVIDIGHITTA